MLKKQLFNYILLLLFLPLAFCQSVKKEELVKIENNSIISSEFIGNGVEWSAYPHADADDAEWGLLMTNKKWETVFKRLDYMKPKIVRVLDQANWRYLEGIDKNGNPILNFENQEMQALYKLLDYCQKNDIKVILGEWGQPYKVHDTHLKMQDAFTGATDPKWLNSIAEHLNYLVNTKEYTCIKYYNLVNEPNGYWSSIDGNWDEWKLGVKKLDSAFASKKLKTPVKVIGPDATPFNNNKSRYTGEEWAKEAVLQLSDVLAAYDVHNYPTKEFVRSGDFEKHYTKMISFADSVAKKPFILGEIGFEKYVDENIKRYEADPFASPDSQLSVYDYDYGVDMADALIQSMNSGFDAVIAWGLDDAMHTNGDTGEKNQLKKWGMWNILGKELTGDAKEEDIRPWFYTWSIITRYFTEDMKIVKTTGLKLNKVRMVSGWSTNNHVTFSIVNNSSKNATFTLDTKNLQNKNFKKFIYSEKNRPVDGNNFPKAVQTNLSFTSDSKQITIPAKSVLLYTTYNY